MRFISFVQGDVPGLSVRCADGKYHGLRESDAAYPGSLDDLMRQGTVAFANAVPIAAVPLIVPDGGPPLESLPPQATRPLVRIAMEPICSVRRSEALRSFIEFLLERVMRN